VACLFHIQVFHLRCGMSAGCSKACHILSYQILVTWCGIQTLVPDPGCYTPGVGGAGYAGAAARAGGFGGGGKRDVGAGARDRKLK
jgi:hypothetical protein